MGMLSGVAALLHIHIDSAKKELIRGEINLAEAVAAHISWKVRLQNYLNGKSDEKLDPMVVCRDDQCSLGKWIHGSAMNHFHAFEPFHQLRADHAQFHYVAANVVKNVQAGDKAAAEEMFNREYQQVSHKVVMALTELNNFVNQ
jgi:hypothetical protein